jgi:hypothetical protein
MADEKLKSEKSIARKNKAGKIKIRKAIGK